MEIQTTNFEELLVIKPTIHSDERGSFAEIFRQDLLEKMLNHSLEFVQDNETHSKFGVVRGLHFQLPPFAQSKLVRVVQGKVLDVVVDLRKKSKTLGKAFTIELSDDNKKQLFVPRGFAHGYITLSPSSIFQYKVDNYYDKPSERSIQFDDPHLAIDWQLPKKDWVVSDKDKKNPLFHEAVLFDSEASLYG